MLYIWFFLKILLTITLRGWWLEGCQGGGWDRLKAKQGIPSAAYPLLFTHTPNCMEFISLALLYLFLSSSCTHFPPTHTLSAQCLKEKPVLIFDFVFISPSLVMVEIGASGYLSIPFIYSPTSLFLSLSLMVYHEARLQSEDFTATPTDVQNPAVRI